MERRGVISTAPLRQTTPGGASRGHEERSYEDREGEERRGGDAKHHLLPGAYQIGMGPACVEDDLPEVDPLADAYPKG